MFDGPNVIENARMKQRSPQVKFVFYMHMQPLSMNRVSVSQNNNDPSKGNLQGDGAYDLFANQLGIADK